MTLCTRNSCIHRTVLLDIFITLIYAVKDTRYCDIYYIDTYGNPLPAAIKNKISSYIFCYFSILRWRRCRNPSSWNAWRTRLYYIVNTAAVDVLETQGARASAAMFGDGNPPSAREGLIHLCYFCANIVLGVLKISSYHVVEPNADVALAP